MKKTKSDSARLKEIRERAEESMEHYSVTFREEVANKIANEDIPWLLKRDKERDELLAALLPAAEIAILSLTDDCSSVYGWAKKDHPKQYEAAKAAVEALKGKGE